MGVQSVVSSAVRSYPTAISLLVDRSGSMDPYVTKVIESVTNFISEQQKQKGKAFLSISQFNNNYDVVIKGRDIKEVKASEFQEQYSPRGGTSLRDGIIQSVADMEKQLKAMKPEERPKKVVLATITDGEDTMSHASTDDVRKIVAEKENLGWEFLLLGMDQNTIKFMRDLGYSEKKTGVFGEGNIDGATKLLSAKVTQARLGKTVEFTQQDRQLLLGNSRQRDL